MSGLPAQLAAALETAGARLEHDDYFSRTYGLHFTITRFESLHAHVNLGVHVTTSFDDLDRLEAFGRATRRGVVLKAVYVEMDQETVDSGGILAAIGAFAAFLFDRRYAQSRAVGVRIFSDCSFLFFDIEDAIQRLKRIELDDDLQIGEDMYGRIIAYFTDKGFGFIQTQDERKFFFHIANIVDDELRAQLPGYVPGEVIPVDFQYGGNDGKKYPKAINVASPQE